MGKGLNSAIYEDSNCLNIVENNTTLDEWYMKCLSSVHKYKVIRENTKRHYNNVYQKYIFPTLGNFRLSDITQLQIKSLINRII